MVTVSDWAIVAPYAFAVSRSGDWQRYKFGPDQSSFTSVLVVREERQGIVHHGYGRSDEEHRTSYQTRRETDSETRATRLQPAHEKRSTHRYRLSVQADYGLPGCSELPAISFFIVSFLIYQDIFESIIFYTNIYKMLVSNYCRLLRR